MISERPGFVDQARDVASWTPRRFSTAQRLIRTARQLAAERGFDDFTLDELAERAGVSRRSLFNYFPSKVDAVLGLPPRACAAAIDEFAAGGPSGDLLYDAGAVVHALLQDKDMSHEDWVTLRRVMDRNPKLAGLAIERFRDVGVELVDLVSERDAATGRAPRGTALVAVFAALFEVSTTAFTEGPADADLGAVFDDQLEALVGVVSDNLAWRTSRGDARAAPA